MHNYIISSSLKHSNSLVQCLNVDWVDSGECRVVFLGAKYGRHIIFGRYVFH